MKSRPCHNLTTGFSLTRITGDVFESKGQGAIANFWFESQDCLKNLFPIRSVADRADNSSSHFYLLVFMNQKKSNLFEIVRTRYPPPKNIKWVIGICTRRDLHANRRDFSCSKIEPSSTVVVLHHDAEHFGLQFVSDAVTQLIIESSKMGDPVKRDGPGDLTAPSDQVPGSRLLDLF